MLETIMLAAGAIVAGKSGYGPHGTAAAVERVTVCRRQVADLKAALEDDLAKVSRGRARLAEIKRERPETVEAAAERDERARLTRHEIEVHGGHAERRAEELEQAKAELLEVEAAAAVEEFEATSRRRSPASKALASALASAIAATRKRNELREDELAAHRHAGDLNDEGVPWPQGCDEAWPDGLEDLRALLEAGPWTPCADSAAAEYAAEEAKRHRFDAAVARALRDGRHGIPPERAGLPADVSAEARRQLDAELAAHRATIEAAGHDASAAERRGGPVVIRDDAGTRRRPTRTVAGPEAEDE